MDRRIRGLTLDDVCELRLAEHRAATPLLHGVADLGRMVLLDEVRTRTDLAYRQVTEPRLAPASDRLGDQHPRLERQQELRDVTRREPALVLAEHRDDLGGLATERQLPRPGEHRPTRSRVRKGCA